MFEPRTTLQRSSRHRTSALTLSVLLNLSGIGSLLTLGDIQHIIEDVENAPLIEVVLAPVRAPAAAAAVLSAAAAPKPRLEPAEERIAAPPSPVPLASPEPSQVADDAIAGSGSTDVAPALGDCPTGQVCDGSADAAGTDCPPGQECGEDRTVVFSVSSAAVRPKRRVRPTFPDAAKQLNISEARCLVRFDVDDRGRPTGVEISDCPNVFHGAVREAAWKWRFYPVRDPQGIREATFTLALTFILH